MLSLTVRLGKDLGKVWSRLKGVKRTKRGKYGRKKERKKERKKKRWNKNSPRLWRVKIKTRLVQIRKKKSATYLMRYKC